MRVAISLVVSSFLVACAAEGKMEARASSDESSASASASASAEGETTKTEGTKTMGAADAPSTGDAPAAQPAAQACPLQCFIAQRQRVTPQEEQRLTTELADPLTALRGCGPGNSLTLRFDSGGQLTEFGVDADRGNEGACVQSVRQKRPTVTYPGPSTLRCYERCGNEPVRGNRRRR